MLGQRRLMWRGDKMKRKCWIFGLKMNRAHWGSIRGHGRMQRALGYMRFLWKQVERLASPLSTMGVSDHQDAFYKISYEKNVLA